MVSGHQEPAMSLLLSGNSTEYAGNMSCVTLQRELAALCSNASMAGADECNRGAQGINLAVPITMTTFGVCGNILALLVLYSSRQEAQARRTVFFVMLSGLAWTDLTCQLAVSPIAIITYANKLRWVGGKPLCLYHGFMMVSFGMVMPLIICCMSLERLLAIKFSYCYTRRVTRRKALMTFLACWGVTLAFTVLPLIGFGSYELQYPGSWCFLNFHRESRLDAIYAGIFSSINILAILTMIVSNLTVAGTLCRMRLSRQLTNSPSLDRKLSLSGQFTPSSTTCAPGTVIRGKRHSDMEAQMIWFLGLITVAFSVCWLPLNVHILLMQFTGYTDCVLDLKVIRMASCNQILDPWLYVIFRKNSILRIVRRIRACFSPQKVPPRAVPVPHRTHYMMENRSYTVDATVYGRTVGNKNLCRHLILGGADLIGGSERGNGFVGGRLGGSNTDVLCSRCSLSDDNDCADNTGRDPLIQLRLGSSPTSSLAKLDKRNARSSFDTTSKSDVEEEEDSTHETDLFSDRIKPELASSEKSKSAEEKSDSAKSPLLKSKAGDNSTGPKEKLRWFLPGLNSNGGDAFASYESTETSSFPSMRPPSIKSPHPIYKQKVHPSRSLLSQVTPGFSPADFLRGTSASANQSAFTFPPTLPEQDILSQTTDEPWEMSKTLADNNQSNVKLESAGPLSKSGLVNGSGEQCTVPHSLQIASSTCLPLTLSGNNELRSAEHNTNLLSKGKQELAPQRVVNEKLISPSKPLDTLQWKSNDTICSASNGKTTNIPNSLKALREDTNLNTGITNIQNIPSSQITSPTYQQNYRDKKLGLERGQSPRREFIKNGGEVLKDNAQQSANDSPDLNTDTSSAELPQRVHNAIFSSKVGHDNTAPEELRESPEDLINGGDTTEPLLTSKSSPCAKKLKNLPHARPVPLNPYSTSRTSNGSIPKSNSINGDSKHTQV